MKKIIFVMVVMMLFMPRQVFAEASFPGLDQLVGQCWQAPFADQKKHDTHCFDWLHGHSFIQDQHLVCGDDSDYAGTTIYVAEKDGGITYRYYNSVGGVSDGKVRFDDGVLHFPEEIYENAGTKRVFSTQWQLTETGYVAQMSQIMPEKPPQLLWNMAFKRIDIDDNALIKRNQSGQLVCQ